MNNNRFIQPYQSKLSLAYRALDILILCLVLPISCWFFDAIWDKHYTATMLITAALMILLSTQRDLYRPWHVVGLLHELFEILKVWGMVIGALLIIGWALKTSDKVSRLVIASWITFTPLMMIISRIALRRIACKLRKKGWNVRTVAIVGANQQGVQFAKNIKKADWMGLKLLGFYDDRGDERVVEDSHYSVLGNLDSLVAHARRGEIDLIYITMPLRAEDRTRELIHRLSDTTVSLYYVPDFVSLDILHARWETVGDAPIISIFENPYHGIDGWAKRALDIVLSSIVLTVISIPMLAIALGVKLSSPGPVIFKQHRYGFNGQKIEVWKFRSMTVCEDDGNIAQAKKCDPRVTRFGGFLRRTSLDELPQFLNVLKGDMSIVGPRPHAVAHNEQYRSEIHRYMMRHKVKPGITGWAQINGWRGETDSLEKMQKRIEYDLEYIQNWSVWLDLKIFTMTFYKGFVSKNAY